MQKEDSPPSSAATGQHAFYRDVLNLINNSQIPYLVGGGYALDHYTGIVRHSKDLDLVLQPTHAMAVLKLFSADGYRTELCFPHWLGKIFGDNDVVDIIFNSGNGICKVDNDWFAHSVPGEVLGITVKLCPAEELIWTKGFIMERERYDGADIAHLVRARGAQLDWSRLLRRFDQHWQVLLSHLILFDFIYPSERARVPCWVVNDLMQRIQSESADDAARNRLCRGTLLSRSQYRVDVEACGYEDARQQPIGSMTPEEATNWTKAGEEQIEGKKIPAA
jgi:aminoglycoside-2''-adenylyltransferase